jgi:hypothetical protein
LFSNDIDYKFDKFLVTLNSFIDNSTQSTNFKTNKTVIRKLKPWISDGLCSAILSRDRLAKKVKRNPENHRLKSNLKAYSKKIKSWVQKEKQQYYSSINELPPRQKWSILNKLCGNPNKKRKFNIKIEHGNSVITDEGALADLFNNFFVNLPKEVATSIKVDSRAWEEYKDLFRVGQCPRSIFFEPVTYNELLRVIYDLKQGKAPGDDGITSKLLKNVAVALVPILVDIFNFSLSSGKFPNGLKLARVIPIFKNGSHSNLINYRPISLVSVFSKLLEKIVKKRLLKFLDLNNFFYGRQFGFREGFSTEMALESFMASVYLSLNSKNTPCVAGLFLDIRKAFDTVNHSVLLDKLHRAGIRGVAQNWFASYLSDRMQYVVVGNARSEVLSVDYGVPQGSVLGPVLFLIFMNDLFQGDFNGMPVSFADDTALSYCGADREALYNKMQEDLNKLLMWFNCNSLSLNVSKTKYLLFTLSTSWQLHLPLKFHNYACDQRNCDCDIVMQSDSLKYLGVTLDERLSWSKHIGNLKTYLLFLLRKFYFLKKILPQAVIRQLYFALVDSKINYGISCWGSTYKTYLKPLITLQKSIIRVMKGVKRTEHSFPIFQLYNCLPLRYIYVFKVLSSFFMISGDRSRQLYEGNHLYSTRSATNNILRLPKAYSTFFQKSFVFLSPKFFNNLPDSIKRTNNIYSFKKQIYKWLICASSETIERLFTVIG